LSGYKNGLEEMKTQAFFKNIDFDVSFYYILRKLEEF